MSGPVAELLARGISALRRSSLWWGLGIACFALLNQNINTAKTVPRTTV
jgi:hypothetical protein